MRHGVGNAKTARLGERVAEAGGQGEVVLQLVNVDGHYVPLFRRNARAGQGEVPCQPHNQTAEQTCALRAD